MFGQHKEDSLIRRLENTERLAILNSDTATLYDLMSRSIVVQNPENTIVGFDQIMDRIRNGKINYTSFERRIDNIAFINGMAVVMGQEKIIPKGIQVQPGKTITRRFTNIWGKENGHWKLTARQATIVSDK